MFPIEFDNLISENQKDERCVNNRISIYLNKRNFLI
jgi:hypothetical protein